MKKRTKKRKPPTEGFAYEFHGSFANKAAARERARKKGGWFVSRKVTGMRGLRYIVLAERVPF